MDKNKILFITTRNILNNCGEKYLIKNRADALWKNWGISTEFIVLCSRKKINQGDLRAYSNVSAIKTNFYNPISTIMAFRNLKKMIKDSLSVNQYDCIILSGVFTSALVSFIKKIDNSIKIVADIHGALEDTLYFAKNRSIVYKIKNFILFLSDKMCNKFNFNKIDSFFVVSEAMIEYVNETYNLDRLTSNFYIIPCASNDQESFDIDSISSNRKIYRKRYSLNEDDLLFIYAGGISPWQCIDDSIRIYRQTKEICNRNCKMLILSSNINNIKNFQDENNDIIIDTFRPEEVKNVLCAGDYAFLIRKDCITNNVAYPNKFLEYVSCNLNVITTPFIHDIAKQVQEYDIGVIVDENTVQAAKQIINYNKNDDIKNRLRLLQKTSFLNTLNTFVKDLSREGRETK